ncbi:hypothetical protein WJX72_002712 [[Myrmecia] bisecta]|uniref:A-kinase anchor protein 7-like phosphoesterase domain-containing protein n=1 Tax=[Myrmecia] bisecta TaxID=41462 RepID=A0AAW1QA46_9CHLO
MTSCRPPSPSALPLPSARLLHATVVPAVLRPGQAASFDDMLEFPTEIVELYSNDEQVYKPPRPTTTRSKPAAPRRGKPRPDHFLALQLSHSPEIQAAMASIQASLTQHTPALHRALVDPASAHMTLMVMHLGTEALMEQATAAMDSLPDALKRLELLQPLVVTLQGLKTFNDKVLFLESVAEGQAGEQLHGLAAAVQSHFHENGCKSADQRPFAPHVTVAKLSKMAGFKRRGTQHVSQIPQEAYKEHVDITAGSVQVQEVQLCRMQGRRDGKYYHVHQHIPLA